MALTKIGSIGINTGIAFAGVTTIATLNASDNVLSVGGTVNFVSDVSIGGTVSIAGTLTYEDVTNVDAVGLITARDGIKVGSGITLSVDGDIFATGVTTATKFVGDGSELTGVASTENIRTNTNATFLQNVTVVGTSTVTGNIVPSSDSATDIGTNSVRFQNAYVDTYYGDGSNLTGIAATDNVRTGILDVAGIATFRNDVLIGTAVTISESGIAAAGIGITVANINGGQVGGRRNMVINGAMQIAQRGTSSSSNGYKTIDRWDASASGMDQLAFTQKQSSDHPDGHYYSFEVDITTAETAQAGDEYMRVQHIFEAQDLQHLAYGTSSAKSTTLSFWVEAKQTGTYAINWYSSDGSRHISRTYTINAADTWEHKTVTIPGDTGGTINNDNGSGIHLAFILIGDSGYVSADSTSWGSYSDSGYAYGHNVNMGSSTNNYWKITGVQWEVGTEGTSYEHRSLGEELALCQRYFYMHAFGAYVYTPNRPDSTPMGMATQYTITSFYGVINYPVPMRAHPSFVKSLGTDRLLFFASASSQGFNDVSNQDFGVNASIINYYDSLNSSAAAGWVQLNNNNAYVGFDAELS